MYVLIRDRPFGSDQGFDKQTCAGNGGGKTVMVPLIGARARGCASRRSGRAGWPTGLPEAEGCGHLVRAAPSASDSHALALLHIAVLSLQRLKKLSLSS